MVTKFKDTYSCLFYWPLPESEGFKIIPFFVLEDNGCPDNPGGKCESCPFPDCIYD